MNKNIKELIDKYEFNQDLRKYTYKHFSKDMNIIHRQINTKNDVEMAKNEIEYDLDYYSKIHPLIREDMEQIEKSLGKYEIAICKILQCYDIIDDFNYSAEELKELIDNRFEYEKELSELRMRMMCQG